MEDLLVVIDYLPVILGGVWLTVSVSLFSLLLSVLLGIITALGKLSGSNFLNGTLTLYTTIIRGIPDLILMLLIYYGGQILLNELIFSLGFDTYIEINPFVAGVCTLGFIFGAYMGETFRGAILAVSKGSIEAGHAFGMTSSQVFFKITVPEMIAHALPGFTNNWLVLLKSTALISIIGLDDMVRRSKMAGDSVKQPFTFLFLAALLYLLITALSNGLLNKMAAKFGVGK